MKNNPVQVVFNAQNYIYKPDPIPGGALEDFYGGRDDEFREHKDSLNRQVEHIHERIIASDIKVAVVKVELNPAALAKSHRPMRSLFPENKSPHIGGLRIGTLLFQVTENSLTWLRSKINEAEPDSRLTFDKQRNKMVYRPSQARSETGAVDRISIYGYGDKLNFTIDEAIDWLGKEGVSKGYLVELVDYVKVDGFSYKVDQQQIDRMKSDLESNLLRLGSGVVVSKASLDNSSNNILYVRLFSEQKHETVINFSSTIVNRGNHSNFFDLDPQRHELLINTLATSPLIKKISLPPMLSRTDVQSFSIGSYESVPSRTSGDNYPLVGLIDSGVKNPALSNWIFGVSKGFSETDCDPDHGSQVASLLIGGKSLNPHLTNIEDDGCLLYDIWTPIHNDKNSFFDNFDGIGDFFDWLDIEIKQAKDKGIRIFNFSLNLRELVRDESYSIAANYIDRISKKHDVIFVISAGNLEPIDYRAKWPSLHAITSDVDRILQPADAVSAITVGAINPPGNDKDIQGTPTVYSRRGPSVAMGVKPDLVHFGSFTTRSSVPGVLTANSSNLLVDEAGTSFSAPLVAKMLSSVEHKLNSDISRNALIATLLHHADFPNAVNDKDITTSIKRRFLGFGFPVTSDEMLVTDDHAITILFEGVLKKGEVAEFRFQWPDSLVEDGKCFGSATLTLAYDPITNLKFGAEYCRVNIDSFLQQEKLENGEWKYRKNCESIWKTEVGKDAYYEKSQIEHGLKWWPIKKYKKKISRGVGKSNNWRLQVKSVEREPGDFPLEGIKFSVVMTIEDHKKQSNKVFDEVKQSLTATGVDVRSIQVKNKVQVGANN